MAKVRKADFKAILVYVDGPQLILLTAGKTNLIATSVPCDDGDKFAAVTVRKLDLIDYFDEKVDLRYLFSFPKTRSPYYIKNPDFSKKVEMVSFEENFPEEHLPEKGFFSSEHTEDFILEQKSSDIELLSLAGKWELYEFGSFHHKFADIYAFSSSLRTWCQEDADKSLKDKIKIAFKGKPLRGGSSYQGLFSDLERHVPHRDRLRLNKIRKASPGKMEILGKDDLFDDVKALVNHFRKNRPNITDCYGKMYEFLQKGGYLKMSVDGYSMNDRNNKIILDKSRELSNVLGFDEFETVLSLCEYNALKVAKVVLALHRRIEGVSLFFAQGRVDFDDGVF